MKRSSWVNLGLVLAVIALAVLPLVLHSGGGAQFGGSDGQAEEQIAADNPGYQPWFSAIYEPPSAEIESGLFALQAALGAGFLGYYFGVARTRRRLQSDAAAERLRER